MALGSPLIDELVPLLFDGAKIASFGYPDIVAPEGKVLRWLGKREIDYRDDAEQICKWHGLQRQRIPDAKSFFQAFGCELTVFDIAEIRGGETILDLNRNLSVRERLEFAGKYDFVLDVGTLEHCFNVGNAMSIMADLTSRGGYIFHGNPFSMGNHGFYGLNPTFYADFYQHNDFEILWCRLAKKGTEEYAVPPLTSRFLCEQGEVNIFAAARRREVRSIKFPIQTKYANLTKTAEAA